MKNTEALKHSKRRHNFHKHNRSKCYRCSCWMCRPRGKTTQIHRDDEAVAFAIEDELGDWEFWEDYWPVTHPDQGDEVYEEELVRGHVLGWDYIIHSSGDWEDDDDYWDAEDDYWESLSDRDDYDYAEEEYEYWDLYERGVAIRDWNHGISRPDLFTSKEEEIEQAYRDREWDALHYDGPEDGPDRTDEEIAEWEWSFESKEIDAQLSTLEAA